MYFDPSPTGYEVFRELHCNCLNGIMHLIFVPLAAFGIFLMLRSFTVTWVVPSNRFRNMVMMISGVYAALYLRIDPLWGVLTAILYYFFITRMVTWEVRRTKKRKYVPIKGWAYMAVALFILENIAQGYVEGNHSDLWQLPNSLLHTPLYTVKVLSHMFQGKCWIRIPGIDLSPYLPNGVSSADCT